MLLRNVDIHQRSNIPGPTLAGIVTPKAAGRMISRAKRPLLVAGSRIVDENLVEYVIEIGRKGVPIAATGDASKAFADAGYTENVWYINLHALTTYLTDPLWKGLDGGGAYDVVVFIGHIYFYASQMLAGLKNFAPALKAINIDRHYQPNAYVSLKDMDDDEFLNALREVIDNINR
jgi:acetyl-CoA decarbonylase/synthase complex subunit epsilon